MATYDRFTFHSQRLSLNCHRWTPSSTSNTRRHEKFGNSRPVICLHGGGGLETGLGWTSVAEELAAAGYTVYAPDLRGHGDSAHVIGGMYHFLEFLPDLAKLVTLVSSNHPVPISEGEGPREPHIPALHGTNKSGPVNIIGHSWGSAVASMYTGLYPANVCRLVCIDALFVRGMVAPRNTDAPARFRDWMDAVQNLEARPAKLYPSIDSAARVMKIKRDGMNRDIFREGDEWPAIPMERALALASHSLQEVTYPESGSKTSYQWKFDQYVSQNAFTAHCPIRMNLPDVFAIWSQITCPVLLVFGAQSNTLRSATMNIQRSGAGDDICQYIPNSKLVLVANAGHWVYQDNHDGFMEKVLPFLYKGHQGGREEKGKGERTKSRKARL